MKNLISFESYDQTPVNEGFWDSIFGRPSAKDAADTHLRAKGWSHMGKEEETEENYVMFNGQKFLPDQIEYDSVYSTKDVPRVENGILIIANPAWKL